MRSGRVAGKVALVTGGASGLGEAFVRTLAAEGAHVIIADIDVTAAKALAAELGEETFVVNLDVTSEAAWDAALAEVGARHGRLDVLVNNAGITTVGSVETLSLANFRHMLDIDLIGVFLGCKCAIPLMSGRDASIINISSLRGLRPNADLAGYTAAKAAVTMLTKSAALHYAAAGHGIRCNSVHPGAIQTPILNKVLDQVDDREALHARWRSNHPLGRLGVPQDVAAIVLYLASDESSFATGAEFLIDGGAAI